MIMITKDNIWSEEAIITEYQIIEKEENKSDKD